MADVITRLKVDSSEYDNKLKRAVGQLQNMAQEVRRTGATFAYADDQELAFIRSLGQMQTQTNSAKGQVREFTEAILSLQQQYKNLTAEEKSSPFGQAMLASIDQLKQRAADAQDMMTDLSTQIKNMASDTATFDALSDAVGGMVAVFQVGQGALQMFGVQNEDAMQAMAKLQGAIAVTTGLTKLQTVFQKQSAVMTGIATLQKKALTAAEKLDTAAKGKNIIITKGATVAQAALNAVAYANPYVLLAMAIIGVGAALIGMSRSSKSAESAEESANKEAERSSERLKKLGESIGEVTAKYRILQEHWKQLSTVADKQTWINENKNAFEQLGLKINSIVDAEDVFVNNSDKVVKALQARAKAAALAEIYQEEIKRVYQDAADEAKTRTSEGGSNYFHKGSRISDDKGKANAAKLIAGEGGRQGTYNSGDWYTVAPNSGTYHPMELNEGGAQKLNEANRKIIFNKLVKENMGRVDQEWMTALLQAEQEADQYESDLNGLVFDPAKKEKQNSTRTTPKPKEGSIAYQENLVRDIETKLKNAVDPKEIEQYKAQLSEAKKKLDEMKAAIKDVPPIEFTEKGLSDLRKRLKDTLSNAQFGSNEYMVAANNITDLTTFENLLKVATEKGVQIDPEDFSFLFDQIKLGMDVTDYQWTDLVTEINEKLADLKLQPIELDLNTGAVTEKIEEVKEQMKELPTAFENFQSGVGAVGNLVSSLDNLKSVGDDLASVFAGEKDAWESMMTVLNSGMSILQTVVSVTEAINTLTEIGTALKMAHAAAAQTEATTAVAAASTEVAAEGEVAAASATTTGIKAGEAAAGAGEAMSGIPIVGPILAIAAIAAVLAAIFAATSKAKNAGNSFSGGGMVGGNMPSGDNVVAYLNSGEGVLTKNGVANANALAQQSSLTDNLHLSTEISGTNIRVVLDNDNRSKGGSRGHYSRTH